MTPLLILIAVIVLAGAWLLDRRDKRHQDDRNRLLTLIHDEREAMAVRAHDERIAAENARARSSPDLAELVALVDRLCQRVQAPAQAVHEHAMQIAPESPEPVSMFNDEQYWESKDQLAVRAMAEELDGAS